MKSNLNILIVEDEFSTRTVIHQCLISLGYQHIHIAKNSDEALHLIDNNTIDITLCDIGLTNSRLDGIALAQEINTISPVTRIIFITAYTDNTTIERSNTVHHANYLIKPVSEAQIRVSIEKAIYGDGEQGVSANPPHRHTHCPFVTTNDEVYVKSNKDKYYYKIQLGDIIYLESILKTIEFVTEQGRYCIYGTLVDIIEQMNYPSIIQINRNFAINLHKVRAKSENDVMMSNGKELGISKVYKTEDFERRFVKIEKRR